MSYVYCPRNSRRGHPAGFAALWRDQLLNLKGDQGARDIIAAHAGQLVLLPTEDPGVLLDVDTPADLDACTSINRRGEPGG